MKPPAVAGLYVHFPWCVKKCPYCDFNSHPLRGSLPERNYVDALLDDLKRERRRFGNAHFTTVYFGGGTPSLFSPESFRTLLAQVPEASEVTLEANPGTVEHGDFAAYRRAGVTRVSLGAQSFDAAQLQALGRIHAADDTRRAVEEVVAAGFDSFNIDLMYGLPNQTVTAALRDLRQAIRLAAPHISWYQLTVEPKTEFARRPPAGLPDGDSAAAIEAAGVELLLSHGYRRYEVSAYARDGHRSAHNMNYWRFGDYAGIGAGAHGKLTTNDVVVRYAKPAQPRIYLNDNGGGIKAPVPADELPLEFMMNALRLTDGVEPELFTARTGLAFDALAATVDELVDWQLMRSDRLALTELGYRQLNGVLARF